MAKKPVTKEGALNRLTSLCSRSEQCEYDLDTKMRNWGLSSTDRKEVIEYLSENRYLDNGRFARSYANDKARFSAWGPYKIRMELAKRRINSGLITEALENVDKEVWKEGLLKNAESKAKSMDLTGEDGYDERTKLYRYLIGRGYPSSASTKAVSLMKKRQEEIE